MGEAYLVQPFSLTPNIMQYIAKCMNDGLGTLVYDGKSDSTTTYSFGINITLTSGISMGYAKIKFSSNYGSTYTNDSCILIPGLGSVGCNGMSICGLSYDGKKLSDIVKK